MTPSTCLALLHRLLAAWMLWASAGLGLPAQANALDHLAQQLQPHPLMQQLHLVNQAINTLDHAPMPGVWQTPDELLQRGAGDCKDLAYTKYWLLQRTAPGHRAMRLGYGHLYLEGRWQLHLVVLVWTDEGAPWVLDNVSQHILRLDARPDLALQFSFDEHATFAGTTGQPLHGVRVKGFAAMRERMPS